MITQLVINGLAMGAVYALVALGMVILYNAAGVVNFAQGEFVMLGAFVSYTFVAVLKLPYVLAFLATMVVMGLFGVLFQFVTYYPIRRQSPWVFIITTISAGIVMTNGARIVWGSVPLFYPSLFGDAMITVGDLAIVPQHLFVFAVATVLMVLFYLFFNNTFLGRKMKATAQDQSAASLMGINTPLMIMLTFSLSSMLGGAAGMLLAPLFFVSTEMGASVVMKAFAATVVGGFGSVPGAIVGGLLLGLIEIFGAFVISPVYQMAISFMLLILVLLFRPRGIFGERISQKV